MLAFQPERARTCVKGRDVDVTRVTAVKPELMRFGQHLVKSAVVSCEISDK